MASPFVPGTSELKSLTYPAVFLELAYKLQAAEVALAQNPNLIQIKVDDDLKIATITAQLPLSVAIDGTGKVTTTPTAYVPTAFVPGNSPLKSVALPAAFLEIASAVLLLEDAKFLAANTFQLRTFVAQDLNAKVARVTAQLPVTAAIDAVSGKPVITATDYL